MNSENTTDRNDFSVWLKTRLKEKHIEPVTLAHMLSVTRATVSGWLNGKRIPKSSLKRKIENVLGGPDANKSTQPVTKRKNNAKEI